MTLDTQYQKSESLAKTQIWVYNNIIMNMLKDNIDANWNEIIFTEPTWPK